MQKGISTQEELSDFKSALKLLASNLDFHVNDSLSRAHGINLIYGFIDSAGNDRRTYQDSFGEIISGSDVTKPNFVRFIIDGVPYYAPCWYNPNPDPGPQPAGTGSIQLTPQSNAIRSATLITDYVTDEIQAAAGVNDYLLAHTQISHQTAHIPMTAFAYNTYAHSGALLADYMVQLAFKGTLYQIPCSTRLGGPPQITAQFPQLFVLCVPALHADPPDVAGTFNGVPGRTYNVTIKVRGILETKVYPAAQMVTVPANPIPPALTVTQFCSRFTGTLSGSPPHDYVHGSSFNEFWIDITYPPANPGTSTPAIYVLNRYVNGGVHLADYTFTIPLTTNAVIRLANRTIDGNSTSNTHQLYISDNSPPLCAAAVAAQSTKNEWIQLDGISVA